MKSKWSNVIKLDDAAVSVETYLMEEFLLEAREEETPASDETALEEESGPSPHDCSALQQEAYETGHQTGMREGEARGRGNGNGDAASHGTGGTGWSRSIAGP